MKFNPVFVRFFTIISHSATSSLSAAAVHGGAVHVMNVKSQFGLSPFTRRREQKTSSSYVFARRLLLSAPPTRSAWAASCPATNGVFAGQSPEGGLDSVIAVGGT